MEQNCENEQKYTLDMEQPKQSALWKMKKIKRGSEGLGKQESQKKNKDLPFRNRLRMKEKYGETKMEV